ncbi:hypothetical protein CDG77_14025 [Nostoc sp. 'Peltigera membranacea cyanobiont' 213]|uniref:hypothetical protein n=1 Tax=Nostoc sp. 'Peltigera membranacea cyanobiont' 213 TaxID=2014530 RepID=UPI000B959B94|nr:hypothetical protein [Nostoc sp. 'Peltigera membranacea cyanobiont' 213]OYD92766.1 hypothetical protein CDG77_14025 [Nostoc sp. 'Peltigera membranacea cyanobiont' 213]
MATTAKAKTTYFIAVGTNGVVKTKAVKNSVKDIADNLGWTESTTGEVPEGKVLLGSGLAEALINGCFPIALYYTKGGTERRAVVLCSPQKADTIAVEGKASKYLGQNIIRVTAVRRRKYVY